MKRLCSLLILLCTLVAMAQTPKNVKYVFTEASDLTLTGRLFPDNPNPYHRIDTVRFKGFTTSENFQVRQSSGIACAFKTNSTTISVQTVYGQTSFGTNTSGIGCRGYDLYIRKDGKWLYAASNVAPDKDLTRNLVLISNMDSEEKECLLYLPLFSEVNSVKIGVQEGARIEPLENPFRHRVCIFGSSFTHGSSTSRAGMAYPAQFSRDTGIQLLSIGCSGNCKMQPWYVDALTEVDCDAFVFDSFSNPGLQEIKDRLFPMIERLNRSHPGKPLIFQRTIYRESRNFNKATDSFEQSRMELVDSLMTIARKRYKDVYYIRPNATAPNHETSVDGTHPGNYGYTLWAQSIEKPICKILKKYGLK